MSLFRKEAIAHQSERLTGDVSLAQPLSLKITAFILVAIALAIVSFLFNAQYARKETVVGYLKPSKGVIKSFALKGGVIDKILVVEGQRVTKNQVLATLVLSQSNPSGVELSQQLSAQLKQRKQLILEQIAQQQQLQKVEANNLASQLLALQSEKQAVEQQKQLAEQKAALIEQQLNQITKLNQQGFVSTIEQQQQQTALLDSQQSKQNTARALLQLTNQIKQLTFEQSNNQQKYQIQVAELKKQLLDVEQQLTQVTNNYHYAIKASENGLVTSIQALSGQRVDANHLVLTLIPEGSELIAEMLLPTRSAGFVQQGNMAKLRFDAFPYQRFGFVSGKVNQIDQTLIIPNEVQLPIAVREPVYRIKASLATQAFNAYGKQFKLKSGMMFEADIMLEQRSLIEWLLEPLYSLKGRMS